MERLYDGILGFTGTRNGLTKQQQHSLRFYLRDCLVLGHGDDKGADRQAHNIAREYTEILEFDGADDVKIPSIKIYPPSNTYRRAYCDGDWIAEPKPFLDRNHDIVDDCEFLIVCPNGFKEVLRSGTWATYRYAVKTEKLNIIIYPDGSIKESWTL